MSSVGALLLAGACIHSAAAAPILRSDRFRVSYEAPRDPAHLPLYEELKDARTLEQFREFVSFIRLPRVVKLKLAGCDGESNAWYEYETVTITVCYEYLAKARRIAPAATSPDGLTPRGAVLGVLLDVLLHETAHALFDQLDIPVLGREEDAADQVAAFILLHQSDRIARDTVLGVAWLYAHDAKGEHVEPTDFAASHGFSAQRFYNLLCLAYGAEPRLFGDLVEKEHLPHERAKDCHYEYRKVDFAIRRLFGPYVDAAVRDRVLAKNWAGGQLRPKATTDPTER